MRRALPLLAILSVACSPSAPPPPTVQVSCVPEASPLRQRCSVTILDRRTGRPLNGATVTLAADMPSMPLAHSVRPATATPGAEPGTYRGTLELEMVGRWVVTVRIAGPVYDQVTHTIDVEHR